MKKPGRAILPVILIILATAAFFSSQDRGKIAASASFSRFSLEFEEDNKPLSTENFDRLNDNEKKAYVRIFNKIKEHPEYIKVPTLTGTEFNNVFYAVKNDNPDMLCFSDSCGMTRYGSACLIELKYDRDADACEKETAALKNRAIEISDLAKNYEDEYERELFIHDYIVKNCEYEKSDNSSNAYGCLIEGKAVCSGYSRACMLLLEYSGINSRIVSGIGKSQDLGEIEHMWNLVRTNGSWYHLDLTWDDPAGVGDENVSHSYFNLTTEEILIDHSDLSVVDSFQNTDYNYFVHENLCFSYYNRDVLNRISSALIENIKNGDNFIEIKFLNDLSYQDAAARIIDDTSQKSDMYVFVKAVKNENLNNIDVTHINFLKDENKRIIRIMFDKAP